MDLPKDIAILLEQLGISETPPVRLRTRKSWDEYFTGIAALVAERSTCLSRNVGAVLVRERRILATGYNGAPAGLPHCPFCIRKLSNVPSGERHELCRGLHAEQNCLIQCARNGVSSNGAAIYVYGGTPCVICAKMLVNAGVRRVVATEKYPDELGLAIMEEAGIETKVIGGNQ
ncbi:MAG TPA: dCMP deaminase family protein [bacterium]|nr:dCMP deaminase family protein [bacterium]